MPTTTSTGRKAELLAAVKAMVQARLPADQRETLAAFIDQYFGQVDPEDLAERDTADLYGAALSHWHFARKREPGDGFGWNGPRGR